MSHLTDSAFRNTVPHLPNSPSRGSGPAKSVTTSHGILSPDLPICSTDQAWPHVSAKSGMRSPTQGDAASPWGKAGWSRIQAALVWSGSRGAVIPGPPPAAQSASRSHKHRNTCSAMQEQPGELQEQDKQTLIFGDHSFSTATATPGQGPDLGAACRRTDSGDWVQGDNMKH